MCALLRIYSCHHTLRTDVRFLSFSYRLKYLCVTFHLLFLDAVSTSPPNAPGFVSTSASSTNSALENYEVEVVEIRVNEGDLEGIIP